MNYCKYLDCDWCYNMAGQPRQYYDEIVVEMVGILSNWGVIGND